MHLEGTRAFPSLGSVANSDNAPTTVKRQELVFRLLFATIALVAALLFCRCGSDRVDIRMWNGERAQLACLTCGQVSWLDGFTVSEFDLSKLIHGALLDQARKQRKRNPAEQQAITQARRAK